MASLPLSSPDRPALGRRLPSTAATVAASWGFAEATLFFIVPDVWLTFVAVGDRRAALWGCAASTVGALAGGLLMFAWGVADADHALAVIDAVPAIDGRMLAHVQAQIEDLGSWALLVGPAIGTPYKVYAATAGAAGVSIAAFVVASLTSRATRFVLLVAAAAWCSEHPLRGWTLRQRRQAVLLFWGLVYLAYFGWHRTL
jgi:membrane protein YqaA with SNARE-associated domain